MPFTAYPFTRLNEVLTAYRAAGLTEVVDHDTFNSIAIVHHGSAIGGSTLSFEETQVLITDGLTAKGKPLEHHLMVTDHHAALRYVLNEAEKGTSITPDLLIAINALVNRGTGKVRQTILGVCDDTKGDLRTGNVTAGNTYFVIFDKVPGLVAALCQHIDTDLDSTISDEEGYRLSFEAHYRLVTIHPWFDGNGRTSRLLMNLIQARCNLPLTIVAAQDKADYIKALEESREMKSTEPFNHFMADQAVHFLQGQIDRFNKGTEGFSF